MHIKHSTGDLHDILKHKKTIEEYHSEAKYDLCYTSLAQYIQMTINEKGLKKSDIIARSNLSKDYAYQIISGRKSNPTRNKVIMLAIGLCLNIDEAQKMLRLSGYGELYPRSLRDSIIEMSINKGDDVVTINLELDRVGLDLLE